MVNRAKLHARAVRWVVRELERRGCVVHVLPWAEAHGVTLCVLGPGPATPLRIAIRAARKRLAPIRVTVAGKRYRYRYWMRFFNLHSHGTRVVDPDAWVLVAVQRHPLAMIVPGSALRGRITLAVRAKPKRRSTLWERWIGRWDVIVGARKAA